MEQFSTEILWVGLDVHLNSITAAVFQGSEREPVVRRLPADLNAVRRYFRALSRQGVPRACYEASGAGYVLQRRLSEDGFACEVVAPSLIPCKPGEQHKTDRLDAIALARLFRSGELTAVAIPSQEQEAVRQLLRTLSGQAQIADLKRRLVGVLACHGHHFTAGRSHWTQAHRAWLKQLRADPARSRSSSPPVLSRSSTWRLEQRALDMEIETLAALSPLAHGG